MKAQVQENKQYTNWFIKCASEEEFQEALRVAENHLKYNRLKYFLAAALFNDQRTTCLACFYRSQRWPINAGVASQANDVLAIIKKLKESDNVVKELGNEPKSKLTYGQLKSLTKKEILAMPASHYSLAEKLMGSKNADFCLYESNKNIEVYYLWGISYVGKTYMAKELAKKYYEKKYPDNPIPKEEQVYNKIAYRGAFWHGFEGSAKVAIFDEFSSEFVPHVELIKLLDADVQSMNIKGKTAYNHFDMIIITTQEDPTKMYPKVPYRQKLQWLRRMTVRNLYWVGGARAYHETPKEFWEAEARRLGQEEGEKQAPKESEDLLQKKREREKEDEDAAFAFVAEEIEKEKEKEKEEESEVPEDVYEAMYCEDEVAPDEVKEEVHFIDDLPEKPPKVWVEKKTINLGKKPLFVCSKK